MGNYHQTCQLRKGWELVKTNSSVVIKLKKDVKGNQGYNLGRREINTYICYADYAVLTADN
jgi:hypothetical protein